MTFESIIAGLGLLDVATFGILNVIATDMVVRRLYSYAPNIWESVGKPVGPLWTPPETTVKDTLTIYERRVSVSELLRRASALANAKEAVSLIRVYYHIHRIALVMMLIGLLCFGVGVAMSFL